MTISQNSYAVGNRVYRGGSSAPTMGMVDPMGYVDRSLNQPSQSRSGLAAAALRRLTGGPATMGTAQVGVPQKPTTFGPASVPLSALSNIDSSVPDPVMAAIPSVRDAVRARMNPDGTYKLNVRQLQEQVAHAHDYSAAAQRALAAMQPIPTVGMMNGTSNGK